MFYKNLQQSLFKFPKPSRNRAKAFLELTFVKRLDWELFAVAHKSLDLRLIEIDKFSVESDNHRRKEFPPTATVVPKTEKSGLRCSRFEIPDGEVGKMVWNLTFVSSLPVLHPTTFTTVDKGCTRLCGVRLETAVISPNISPKHSSHTLF